MASTTFAVVGDNTIDRYVGHEEQDFVGGNAVNVAAQLALSGESVRYYGAVGDDADGDYIREGLRSAGVDVDGLVVLPGSTAVTRIRVDANGERAFEHEDFGVTAHYSPSPEQLREIASAAWVQLGMLPRAHRVRSAIKGVRIGQDCAVSAGFSGLYVAFGSVGADGDAAAFARRSRKGGSMISVVTRGSAGAVAFPRIGEPIAVSAAPARIVDTTGAGDSFIAGFISVAAQSGDLLEALNAGSRFAAATCAHRGGFPQEPHPAAARSDAASSLRLSDKHNSN
ncbi:MAG: PfkB family carbohydrate kinase [Microbacteriaceae bacterium]